MNLAYECDERLIRLSESRNEEDVEFEIQIVESSAWDRVKEIQKSFDENDVYTDVLFYYYQDRVRVVVRQDYYVDFILHLMKHRLATKAEWK